MTAKKPSEPAYDLADVVAALAPLIPKPQTRLERLTVALIGTQGYKKEMATIEWYVSVAASLERALDAMERNRQN
jgi:hypothetical protein